MVVRAVHIHEPFADLLEDCERSGRAVDELAVTARTGEGALECTDKQVNIDTRTEISDAELELKTKLKTASALIARNAIARLARNLSNVLEVFHAEWVLLFA